MYVCLTCRTPIDSLVKIENKVQVAARCGRCDRVADIYVERDTVTLLLGLLLLHQAAWTHVVYNVKVSDRWRTLFTVSCVALLGCVLESFAESVLTLTNLDTLRFVTVAPSLQRQGSVFWNSMGRNLIYSVAELMLTSLCLLWGVQHNAMAISQPDKSSSRTGTPQQAPSIISCLRGVLAVPCAKLIYVLFLVWDLPLYLLVVMDIVSVLFSYMAARGTLGPAYVAQPALVGAVGLAARTVFRLITKWRPVSILLHSVVWLSLMNLITSTD